MARAGVAGALIGTAAAVAGGAVAAGTVRTRQQRRRAAGLADTFAELAPDRVTSVHTEDGVPLHVEEVGPRSAPVTVVFVHGYTLALRSFHFQRRDLAERYGSRIRMVFYDQRSHGRSGASVPSGATIEQLGRDLYGVLSAVVPSGPIVLVGHSMGGLAVQALAEQHPELFRPGPRRRGPRIAGVALLGSSAGGLAQVSFGLPALVGRVQGRLTGAMLRSARRRPGLVEGGRRVGSDLAWLITRRLSFADKTVDQSVVDFLHELISATPIEAIADFHPALMAHDGMAGLAAMAGVPVAIVVGERDLMTPPAHSRRMAEVLPDAELTVIGRAGHLAMLERPGLVDDVLAELVETALLAAPVRSRGS